MIDKIIEELNKEKDWTWKIEKVNENQFDIITKIFYINNLGCMPGQPANTINLILDHVKEVIGVDDLEEKANCHWKQVDSFWREIKITFTLKGDKSGHKI